MDTDILEIEMRKTEIILKPISSIFEIGGSLKKYAKKLSTKEKNEKTAWEKHVKEKFTRS